VQNVFGKSSSKIYGLATGTLASVDDSLQCKVMHLWKLEKCPVEDKVLTANPFLRSEGEEEVRREGSTVGAGASGAAAMARGRRAVARGPRGGRGSRAAGLRGTGRARGRRGARRPELRAAAAMARGRGAVARGPRGGRGSRAAGLRRTSSHQLV
jgi:ATP-dependent helicase HrpA